MIDSIMHGARQAATWALGRGAVYVAIGLTAGLGSSVLPFVAIPLGTLLSYRLVHQQHRRNEQALLKEYSRELGALLGLEPEQVTFEQLKMVSEGKPEFGLPGNPVIKEAIEQNNRQHNWQLFSRVASAVLALGGFSLFSTQVGGLGDSISQAISSTTGFPTTTAGTVIGTGIVYGLSNLAIEHVLYDFTSLGKRTSQDVIKDIERDVSRGRSITIDRVFGAMALGNPAINNAVEAQYGHTFEHLPMAQRFEVMQTMTDVDMLAGLAQDITNRQVRPQELAFIAMGQRSGVPRLETPPPTTRERISAKAQDVSQSVRRRFGKPQTQMGAVIDEQKLVQAQSWHDEKHLDQPNAPVHHTPDASFVEKYASQHGQRKTSHLQAEMNRRDNALHAGELTV